MTSHTSVKNASVTSGLLVHHSPESIVLGLPGTDYQLHLQIDTPTELEEGESIAGRIEARARRVDIVQTGGRYIEPLYGRPRSLQGRISSIDPIANTITVHCGCPFVCQLVAGQKAVTFAPGMLVRFDIERGATFRPA